MNTRRMNRLEELGRVDAEKAYSKKGKRNLKDEKKRIVRELTPYEKKQYSYLRRPSPKKELQGTRKIRMNRAGGGMAQRGLGRAFMKGGKV